MEITSFRLSPDNKLLILDLTEASAVTKLNLYTQETYKIPELSIDLSSKLNGAAAQNITITPEDLGLTEFDGLYFIDVLEGASGKCAMLAELSDYERCVLDEILNTNDCETCPDELYTKALNMWMSLRGIELSVKHNLAQEAITAIYALDKFCKKCVGCGKYKKS